MFERTAQPIQAPDDQCVSFPNIIERVLQAWACGRGAAHPVAKDALAADLLESVFLEVKVLLVSRDACVADFHLQILSC
jgi:hypothetical protein